MLAKKSLGQHFLADENIAKKIVDTFLVKNNKSATLEIGPGTGMLTKYFIDERDFDFYAVEFDERMVNFLKTKFPSLQKKIFFDDFLEMDLNKIECNSFNIIGNFPYNISSQIVFKILENKSRIPLMVGMFQKEVAQRITSVHGNKEYGILSVLVQSFYDCEYLFDVPAMSFLPPPKVTSAVICMRRKAEQKQIINEKLLRKMVKAAFGKRRKTLRNGLGELNLSPEIIARPVFSLRPEQLSVNEWIELSNQIAATTTIQN